MVEENGVAIDTTWPIVQAEESKGPAQPWQTKMVMNAPEDLCDALVHSYGAMHIIFDFIDEREKLPWQQVNSWWYTVGVSRLQISLTIRVFPIYNTVYFMLEAVSDQMFEFSSLSRSVRQSFFPVQLTNDAGQIVQTPSNKLYVLRDQQIWELLPSRGPNELLVERPRTTTTKNLLGHAACAFGQNDVALCGGKDSKSCILYVALTNTIVDLPDLPEVRQTHSICQVSQQYLWVYGGNTTNLTMLNTILRLDVKAAQEEGDASSWEPVVLANHICMPSLQNCKMLQVSNTEVCIFCPGYTIFVDINKNRMRRGKHKVDQNVDLWQMPVLMVGKDTAMTVDQSTKRVILFQKDRPMVPSIHCCETTD